MKSILSALITFIFLLSVNIGADSLFTLANLSNQKDKYVIDTFTSESKNYFWPSVFYIKKSTSLNIEKNHDAIYFNFAKDKVLEKSFPYFYSSKLKYLGEIDSYVDFFVLDGDIKINNYDDYVLTLKARLKAKKQEYSTELMKEIMNDLDSEEMRPSLRSGIKKYFLEPLLFWNDKELDFDSYYEFKKLVEIQYFKGQVVPVVTRYYLTKNKKNNLVSFYYEKEVPKEFIHLYLSRNNNIIYNLFSKDKYIFKERTQVTLDLNNLKILESVYLQNINLPWSRLRTHRVISFSQKKEL